MGLNERTNEEWLNDLRAEGDQQAQALEDLRAIILRGLPYALAGKLSPDSPQFEALAEEVAQETLLRVLDYLDTFEGRSKFTTWVQKIAVREALADLRRRRWKNVPLPDMEMAGDSDIPAREIPDAHPGPDTMAERNDLMQHINRIIMEELTEKQRQAMKAVAMQGMPQEEAEQRLGMSRNTLYKLMHDARLRLKHRLESVGLTPQQVLAAFEKVEG